MNLKNKVVVITGGSQGFGKSLAKLFLLAGSKVVIISKNENSAKSTATEIGSDYFVADVRDESSLKKVSDSLNKIDIWINCAGLFMKFPNDKPLDMNRAQELIDVNFFGTVIGSKIAVDKMKNDEGVIVNIISSAALDATRAIGASIYASSKWAVRGYTDALRSENANTKLKIISVYPGGMKTHFHDEALPSNFPDFMEPDYVSKILIDNLLLDVPKTELIIKRPNA